VIFDFIWWAIEWFWEEIIQDIFRGKKPKRKTDDPPVVM
jgi:hypothetical protein